ncbi:hypothetical protein MRX96_007439 [Rhipicephalus microplus]
MNAECYDFNDGIDYARILESYKCSGFQATHFDRAVNEINRMLECRSVPLGKDQLDQHETDEFIRRKIRLHNFFGLHLEYGVCRCQRRHQIYCGAQDG